MTNFNDISAAMLDWSTSTMPLTVSSSMVLNFLRSLDFDTICSQLVGKKTVKEVLLIAFNF